MRFLTRACRPIAPADVSDTVRTVCDESAEYEFGGTCPAGCQDALDTMYGFCGGTCLGSEMDSVGIEWDSISGAGTVMAKSINAAGCSGAATTAAPVFTLVVATMAFFN